jgi:hypothetical protein
MPVKRVVMRNQGLVRFQSVAGYPDTSAEHAPIANGVIMPVAAPYEMVKMTMVDLMMMIRIQMFNSWASVVWRHHLLKQTAVVKRRRGQLAGLGTPS